MAHDAYVIANKLIQMGVEKNKPLTLMQIIKLVYICHGFMLGIYHRPLINQPVEAWRYGPVIKELYEAMRKYGSSHITKKISRWYDKESTLDEDEQDIVEQVFDKYGELSGVALSTLTHQPNTPWDITWRHYKQKATIPSDLIEEYYSKVMTNGRYDIVNDASK